jgi:hypothetical protein
MRKVYEAENYIDAQIARGWLESAGIAARVSGEHLSGAMGELPALGLHSLWVAEDQLELALQAIAELAQERAANALADEDECADPARRPDGDCLEA